MVDFATEAYLTDELLWGENDWIELIIAYKVISNREG